jgi:hypothetical protein
MRINDLRTTIKENYYEYKETSKEDSGKESRRKETGG